MTSAPVTTRTAGSEQSHGEARRGGRLQLVGRSLIYFAVHDVLVALAALLAACCVWWVLTRFVSADWMPTPWQVVRRCGSLLADDGFRGALEGSVKQAAVGFVLATAIGTVIGIVMGLSGVARSGLRSYLDLLLVIPPAALAPVLIAVVGLSNSLTVIMSAFFAISVIGISTASAVEQVDRSLLEVGLVFGARSRLRLIRTVLLPAMSPAYFSGLHLGMARAMKGMIVGQVVVGIIGIGAYEAQFQQIFDSVGVWSIAVLLVLTSLVMTWLVKAADSVINYWAYRS